jgi:hypothetical protein
VKGSGGLVLVYDPIEAWQPNPGIDVKTPVDSSHATVDLPLAPNAKFLLLISGGGEQRSVPLTEFVTDLKASTFAKDKNLTSITDNTRSTAGPYQLSFDRAGRVTEVSELYSP